MRIYASMRVIGRPSYEELPPRLHDYFKKGLRIGMYGNRLTARAYKISGDGSLGARSAWMLDDYDDRPGHKGNGKWTDEQLYNVLYQARRAGFPGLVSRHWRRGQPPVPEHLRAAAAGLPDPDARLRASSTPRLSRPDIPGSRSWASSPRTRPCSCAPTKVADTRLGPQRIKGAYAWRTLIDQGNVVPNGTDSPVESYNPFLSMYCAVTHMDERGQPERR